jgi:hypothetical protein
MLSKRTGELEQLYRHDKSPTAMALAGFRSDGCAQVKISGYVGDTVLHNFG